MKCKSFRKAQPSLGSPKVTKGYPRLHPLTIPRSQFIIMPGYNLCLELIKMDLHELKMSQARHAGPNLTKAPLHRSSTSWPSLRLLALLISISQRHLVPVPGTILHAVLQVQLGISLSLSLWFHVKPAPQINIYISLFNLL